MSRRRHLIFGGQTAEPGRAGPPFRAAARLDRAIERFKLIIHREPRPRRGSGCDAGSCPNAGPRSSPRRALILAY